MSVCLVRQENHNETVYIRVCMCVCLSLYPWRSPCKTIRAVQSRWKHFSGVAMPQSPQRPPSHSAAVRRGQSWTGVSTEGADDTQTNVSFSLSGVS